MIGDGTVDGDEDMDGICSGCPIQWELQYNSTFRLLRCYECGRQRLVLWSFCITTPRCNGKLKIPLFGEKRSSSDTFSIHSGVFLHSVLFSAVLNFEYVPLFPMLTPVPWQCDMKVELSNNTNNTLLRSSELTEGLRYLFIVFGFD